MEGPDSAHRSIAAIEAVQHFNDIGRPDLAEREARRALAQDPELVALHVLLAQALHVQKRTKEAEEALTDALRRDAECTPALGYKAILAMDAGRFSESERLLLQALALDPMEETLYLNYALLMYKTRHLDKAEQLLHRALEIAPEYPRAHSLLGVVLAEKEKGKQARFHGEMGLHLEAGGEVPHALLGHTYLQTGRPFKARYHLREAVRIDPTDETVLKSYLEADRATRWIYLPMYYWTLLADRLPGKQFSVWVATIVVFTALRKVPGMEGLALGLVLFYAVFCVYTWVASPLTSLWLRLRPPK